MHEGRHAKLEEALKAAYEAARKADEQPPFVVDEIQLHGTNPFTEFVVIVRKPNN